MQLIRDRPAMFELTCRLAAVDGAERVVALRGRVVLDELGQAARLVGTARDITEDWRAQRTRDLLSYVVAVLRRRDPHQARRRHDHQLERRR